MTGDSRFVKCPAPFAPLFQEAERNLEGFFHSLERCPEHGTVSISGERYILARAATFSVELRRILENEYGRLAAEKLAYSLGRAAGIKDAEFFMDRLKLERGPAALSAGPVHFAFVGWAFVDIFPESAPTTDESYYLIYDHPYSFEADSYLREGIATDRPVCHMNAGYSSGWCQVAFGVDLAAKEISCRARGDERCLFVMGHPSRVNELVVSARERYGLG
jgi:son of sevenless-like protein